MKFNLKTAAGSAFAAVLASGLLLGGSSASAATGIPANGAVSDRIASPAIPSYQQESEYYGGYRRYYRHRRRGPNASDIIAGIGIIAGIAIIADAAAKNNDRRDRDRDRDRDYDRRTDRSDERDYDRDRRDRQVQRGSQSYPANNLNSAVAACSNAAEQSAGGGVRVAEIRSATRDGESWRVSGDLNDARSFDCGVGNRGVDFVQLGTI